MSAAGEFGDQRVYFAVEFLEKRHEARRAVERGLMGFAHFLAVSVKTSD